MNIPAVEMAGFLKLPATTAVFVQEPMPEKEESVKEFVTRNLGEEARRSTKPQDGPGRGRLRVPRARDQAGWRGGQVCKTHWNTKTRDVDVDRCDFSSQSIFQAGCPENLR